MRPALFLLFLPLFLPETAAQGLLSKARADSLWAVWSDMMQADSIRLEALHTFTVDGYLKSDPDSAGHFARIQLAFAERTGQRGYMASAHNTIGVHHHYKGEYPEALQHYRLCLAIREDLGDLKRAATSLGNIAIVLAHQGDAFGALEHHRRSLAIRETIDDRPGIASSLNNIGNIHAGQGQYSRALEHYRRSLAVAEDAGDRSSVANALLNIGNIHHAMGDHAAALEHYGRIRPMLEELGDRPGVIDVLLNSGSAYAGQGAVPEAMDHFQRALEASEAIGHRAGMAVALNNLGGLFSDGGDHAQAMAFYLRSLAISEEIGDKRLMASTSNVIGSLLNGQRTFRKAVEWCDRGLRLAEATGSIVQQRAACECLYTAWKAIGDGNKALAFHERMQLLGNDLSKEETKRELQRMAFAETLLRDSLAQAEERRALEMAHSSELRRKNRTRDLLLGTASVGLLLAIGLWTRLRFVRRSRAALQREKDRSEDLLLNILPADIAAELKEKGRAEARDYEGVSILFTDFVDFTATSARMGAGELVAEINTCFEAFDAIMERHRLEKIKTIGDAYMAAGGLPVPDGEAVRRMVLAALEMQDFIAQRRSLRSAQGLPAFAMRAGIHHGPVVAGIVGRRKFQYDLWGDTVNSAARMESNGEAGRVNISAATHALVKDDPTFTFTPRGPIAVKGKGEMEMWFVQRASA